MHSPVLNGTSGGTHAEQQRDEGTGTGTGTGRLASRPSLVSRRAGCD